MTGRPSHAYQEAAKRRAQNPEWRRKNRIALARLHADPEVQRKNRERLARMNADPEHGRKVSEALKASPKARAANRLQLVFLHTDVEVRRKNSEFQKTNPKARERLARLQADSHLRRVAETLARLHADPEVRRKISEARKGQFTPRMAEAMVRRETYPRYRQERAERLARLNADTEKRRKISEARKGQFTPRMAEAMVRRKTNPEWQRKNRMKLAQLNADPDFQRKNLERLRRLHADPVMRARMVRCQNPSKRELALGTLLPDSFVHTGQDTAMCVGGYFPDYQDRERKLVVEYDGHYRHYLTQLGQSRDDRRDRALASLGWRVLHFYPWDLKDPEGLKTKVSRFIEGKDIQ